MPAPALRTLPDLNPAPVPAPTITVLPDPAPDATPTAAPAKRGGGLNLGALGAAKPKAKSETNRPTVPRDQELDALLDSFALIKPQFDDLEAQCDMHRAEIIARCFPHWLAIAAKQPDVGSLNLVSGNPATKLLLSVQNRYAAQVEFSAGQEALMAAITRTVDGAAEPEDATLARFEEAFEPGLTIALKFGEVPAELRQAVIDDLLPVFEKHGLLQPIGDAKAAAAVCKQIVQPKVGFHARRHSLFTIEENLAIQQILPAVGMVKLTGLKK